MFSDQKLLRSILLLTIAFFGCLVSVKAQAVSFTYQGSLKDGAVPANGNFDFKFTVFNSLSGGIPTSTNFSFPNVPVTNGIFSVKIVSGINPFLGGSGFLEIRVGPGGGGATTLLTPRQEITNVPFSIVSIKSLTADNAITLGGIAANQYVTTTGGGTNFVQNSTTQQPTSNFNISGTGTANILTAATQFNIGNNRILSEPLIGNLFAGVGAGGANTGGIFNAFFGSFAGGANTAGSENAFFGRSAGANNTSGNGNSFFGFTAGFFSETGSNNSFSGSGAGFQNTTGSNNTYFGFDAGKANRTGNGNTIIGANANMSGNLVNSAAIGFRALAAQSNSLVLGSISGINEATANTFVGIGTNTPTAKLSVAGNGAFNASSAARFDLFNPVFGMGYLQHVSDTGLWQISTTDGQTKMVITASGNVGINVNAPNDKLDVGGSIRVATLGAAGATAICRNASNQISTCSSSIRYKNNIQDFRPGLNLVRKLRPISFNWKADNTADMGLVAEEVNAIEPLLTTTNDKGEVEGVKYDRVGVVLVNAVNEQQDQIEGQQKQLDEQKELVKLQQERLESAEKQIQQQKSELEALKVLVCSQNPTAEICKPKK